MAGPGDTAVEEKAAARLRQAGTPLKGRFGLPIALALLGPLARGFSNYYGVYWRAIPQGEDYRHYRQGFLPKVSPEGHDCGGDGRCSHH